MFRISRQDSQLMKGIAILLMLFLHLFMAGGIPDHFLPSGSGIFRNPHLLNAKACVSLFAFVTGYGFAFVAAKTPPAAGIMRSAFERMKNFYPLYLFYLAIAVLLAWFFPIGILKPPNGQQLILAASGIAPHFWDWWYVTFFLGCSLILFPLLLSTKKKQGLHDIMFLALALSPCLLVLLKRTMPPAYAALSNWNLAEPWIFVPDFLLGWSWFLLFQDGIKVMNLFKWAVSFSMCYLLHSSVYDIPLPVTTLLCALFVPFLNRLAFVGTSLRFLGTYSVHMWLNHRFLFGYWWAEDFYRMPPFISYAVLVAVSLATAVGTQYLYENIKKCLLPGIAEPGMNHAD